MRRHPLGAAPTPGLESRAAASWALASLALLCSLSGCSGGDEPKDLRAPQPVAKAQSALTTLTPTCATVQRTGATGAVRDTQIVNGPSFGSSSYGSSWTSNSGMIGAPAAERQALFHFDLGGLPAGAVAASATVTLHQTNNATTTVRAHRVLAPWDETQVTWTSFAGAFSAAIVGSFVNGPPNPDINTPTPVSFSLDTSLVQGWLDGSVPNHGFLLEQAATGTLRTTYRTSEWQPVAQRPALTVCYRVTCAAGTADCDGAPQNGCETAIDTTANCGACGAACSVANGTAACVAGACAVGACDAGFGDCDGDAQNGCEAPLDTTAHCGACGVACAFPHASSACVAGACAIAACAPGFGDCDGDAQNGCEAPLDTTASCGACGVVCDDGNECTADACSAGQCAHAPLADGTPCAGGACAGGVCAGGASCSDGIQNQGEDGVDCGGPCPACSLCLSTFDPGPSAGFGFLGYMTRDAQGTLYVTDFDNNVIHAITSGGQVTTLGAGLYGHQDGPVAAAEFAFPTSVAVDAQGALFVADADNAVIRKIAPDGTVSTVAGMVGQWGHADGPATTAQLVWPTDVEIDANGDLLILDYGDGTLRKLDANGILSTVAGEPGSFGHVDGPAANAQFQGPSGMTRDAAGNVYITEFDGAVVRKLDTNGIVSTVAGQVGVHGADDGPAATATFDGLQDIEVDAQGNLLVADSQSATIRRIAADGAVSTLAGAAYHHSTSDGCAAQAPLGSPYGLSLAQGPSLSLSDGPRLRKIGLGGCDCSGASCFDHAQNQGEEGVDCGGPCADACPTCSDGIQNQGEIDVDCGGPCPLCAPGAPCSADASCASNVCRLGTCRAVSCNDGVLNQGEIDVDCGGPCPGCAPGTPCSADGACESGICQGGECQSPTCHDGVKNGGEIDADCAGPCPLCGPGAACTLGSACKSGVCTGGACQAPTCQDGVQNGGEIDADCGGDCGPCPVGKHCVTGADCQSSVCQASLCRPTTCGDGVTDGGETDIDCGGPCAGCAAGKACALDADCAGERCVGLVCGPPPVPTPIDPTAPTDLGASVGFLYTGPDAVQIGVAPGAISPSLVAVARGRVLDRGGAPIPDVKITALDHPEIGATFTRADGAFDLAMNGGERVTLVYSKPGLIPVQRQIEPGWVDFEAAPDVVMIGLDPAVTTVDLENATATQVARGSVTSDADGTRQATAMFEPGTAVEMVLPDGTRREMTQISVRATEFTVGANGREAMPGALPPTSGYTYAVELSADQAFLAGAKEVRFSRPVPVYVENFLGFPVGGVVPVGYYDKERAAWVASDNGRIVKIVSISGGLANLDITGSGAAASAAALASLGVTDGERAELAANYSVGATLWRAPLTHFTPWDCNWPYGPPPGAGPPPGPPDRKPNPDCPSTSGGSVIECEPQILGESIPVEGTPYKLEYTTRSAPGRAVNREIEIAVTGPTVPPNVKRVEVRIAIAGQSHLLTFPPAPNQSYTFTWDGKDGYGRPLKGSFDPTVTVRLVYGAVYYSGSTAFDRAFAQAAGTSGSSQVVIGGSRQTNEVFTEIQYPAQKLFAGRPDVGLGGWSLDVHHFYERGLPGSAPSIDQQTRGLRISSAIDTFAGGNFNGANNGDGGPAKNATLSGPGGTVSGPDGTIYIADSNHVRKVTPDGIIHTIAGCGSDDTLCEGTWRQADCIACECCTPGEIVYQFIPRRADTCLPGAAVKCDAMRVSLGFPVDVKLAPNGSLIVADVFDGIYRIDPDGTLEMIAGAGQSLSYSGDGGPALHAGFLVEGIAVGPDGAIYIADRNGRIRRVGPDGIINTVAGNGTSSFFSGDGGPATQAAIGQPRSVVIAPDGSLYIAAWRVGFSSQGGVIRRVSPDGIITTVAGNGGSMQFPYPDNSGLVATSANVLPTQLALSHDGTLYFDTRETVYRLEKDKTLLRVAGLFTSGDTGDGGLSTNALLASVRGLSFAPDGRLFISTSSGRVRVVGPFATDPFAPPPSWGFPFDVTLYPAGDALYVFDPRGVHVKTVNRMMGTPMFDFFHDASGRPTGIADEHGAQTTIVRDANGTPTAIVAPGGLQTTLAMDANGYLASVTSPKGDSVQMTYAPGGLLSTFTDARGGLHTFTYDARGNLLKDESPSGGFTSLSRVELSNGYEVTSTTALGRTKRFRIQDLANGQRVRRVTDENGGITTSTTLPDGVTTVVEPDGSSTATTLSPDPIWGMLDGYVGKRVRTTLNGATSTLTRTMSGHSSFSPIAFPSFVETRIMDGETSIRSYDAAARALTEIASNGARKTITTYDAYGHPTTVARVDPASLASEVVTRTYDAAGYLTSVVDSTGSWTFTYDGAHRLASSTDGAGNTTLFGYDQNGWASSITDPNGVVTSLVHDADHHVLSRTVAGLSTTFTYDARGNVVTETRPDGSWVTQSYDIDGRLVAEDDSGGGHKAYTLDGLGNRTREDVSDASNIVRSTLQRTFDGAGRMTRRTNGAGDQTNYTYLWGHPSTTTDGLGRVTTTVYDTFDVLESSTDAMGHATLYSIDPSVNAQTVTDARGAVTTYQLDGLDRRLATVSPHSGTTTFTYDAFGRALTRTDARGITTTFTRDGKGRVTNIAYSNGAPGVVYTYDQGPFGKGRLTGIAEGVGATSFAYDARGKVITEQRDIGGVTLSLSRAYDAAGRLSRIGVSGGSEITYTRDAAGRVIAVTADDGALQRTLVSSAAYLPMGPLTAMTLGNGVTVQRAHDQAYRLQRISAGAALDVSYGYDAAGDLVSITDAIRPGESQSFGYDAARWLTTATGAYGSEAYTYDAVGNRTSITRNGAADVYAYGPTSQRLLAVTGSNPEGFAYDANGNAITVGGLSLGYDENNRLSSASQGGSLLATYEHSISGHRVKKTDALGNVTLYLYDAANLLAIADGNGNVIEQYVYLDGLRVAVLGSGRAGAADTSYVIEDLRGATQVMLDQQGQVVWQGSYLPFGEVTVSVGAAQNHFRLAGQILDPETGLFHNGLRTYDPRTGRYLESDPLGLDGGINAYAYTENSPLTFVDPMGLWKLGFSIYDGIGGGFSISADETGWSFCSEIGVGAGGSFDYSPNAKAEAGGARIDASVRTSVGPLSAEAKVGVEAGPCGTRKTSSGTVGVGPLSASQSQDGDWEVNISGKPEDWKYQDWAKVSTEAKVAATACAHF